MSIPAQKLEEIMQICKNWTNKSKVQKADLQSLLGYLLYITKCVKPARFFLNHMLKLLRDNVHEDTIVLNQEFFKDLAWFNTFLNYNGVTIYQVTPCIVEFSSTLPCKAWVVVSIIMFTAYPYP